MSKAYEKAGVNIEAGYESVERMKSHVARTSRKGVAGAFGGFGGMFDLSALEYKEPVLISGTDGVGTKLKLAFMADRHDTIGIDCVAMCVNDIVAQGAEPLYFLDYVALGKAVPEKVEAIVKGVADGCVQSGAALIGGETAEMPGLYEEDEYDLAGFAVGACEKSKLVTGERVQEGDVLVGIASSGIHSNGYSLVRHIVFEQLGADINGTIEGFEDLGTVADALLQPTKIYAKPVLEMHQQLDVHSMGHITGGGFFENLPRMFSEGFGVEVDLGAWPVLPVFHMLKEKGELTDRDLYSVFNMGVGFVVALPEAEAEKAIEIAKAHGEEAYVIGRVTKQEGVTFNGEHDGTLSE
ncbi:MULTISPECIES: phosphoribosylformylglycinamidine cyclo-ligase [unclassified Sporosarcina]|uniref:phosphoribosylformylglycinamidine cyclo-ligase n=1 Tax=unclassified Sporosarcina TaxID=2647733 RepID=UPI000C166698|nr:MULTISPECIES: phosphoribosylformylglycinamidine cyclo-ligase [unclassified Sporosarcina]PID04604.1 phosphoribosylformylglycinamidine cyclo-ligase [Sporosarcina sp. P30]PID07746.1 phosphoribosylformylglycinamidine cyclo-ligase [Sporosarcina sp. P31]PID10944.1 phosphoribosylformylglycinamidine cyclo-ligase [Sporosarcina sp. P32b]